MSAHAEAWSRVKRHNPCPICGKPDWCEVRDDGAIAACNRVKEGSYRTITTSGGELYYHRLTDDRPHTPPPPKPKTARTFDPLSARAVYAFVADFCAANMTDAGRAELARRFGPQHAPRAIEAFGIGYCDPPALVAALEGAGRTEDAIRAGVLRPNGAVVASLAGGLVIPYCGSAGYDLRGSGLKGSERGTKEMSLPGGYAERGVDGLFFNHRALDQLQPGGDLHIFGGAFKAMAGHLSGLCSIGRRGESELSEAQSEAIKAAQPGRIYLHIDSEDPKDGQALSAGRRLALPVAERLATIAPVFIAEPPREAGAPKVDTDSLLRDYGPRMVRAVAASALPLEAFKVAIGVESAGVPREVAEELETLRQRLRDNERLQVATMHVQRNKHIKTEKPTLLAAAYLYNSEASRGKVGPDGWLRTTRAAIAEIGGVSEDVAGDHLERINTWGAGIHKETRYEDVRRVDPEGQVVVEKRRFIYLKVDGKPADVLMPLGGDFNPPRPVSKKTGKEIDTWGGNRPACPKCGGTKQRTVISCPDCGEVFSDLTTEAAEPASIPPTPITPAAPASYPPGAISYEYDDEEENGDPIDPEGCSVEGCSGRVLPKHRRDGKVMFCPLHQPSAKPRQASAPPPPPEPIPSCTTVYEVEPIDWGAVPLATFTGLGADCHICGAGMYARSDKPLLCRDCNDARNLAELEASTCTAAD